MDAAAALEWCDQVITEVDIELMEWRYDIDRMALAGVEVPLVYYADGERYEIGTARLKHEDGALMMDAKIESEFQEQLDILFPKGAYSLSYDPGPPPRVTARPVEPKNIEHLISDAKYGPPPLEIEEEENMTKPNINFRPAIEEWKQRLSTFSIPEIDSKPLTIRGLKEAIAKEEERRQNLHDAVRNMSPLEFHHFYIDQQLKNHPFFNNKEK